MRTIRRFSFCSVTIVRDYYIIKYKHSTSIFAAWSRSLCNCLYLYLFLGMKRQFVMCLSGVCCIKNSIVYGVRNTDSNCSVCGHDLRTSPLTPRPSLSAQLLSPLPHPGEIFVQMDLLLGAFWRAVLDGDVDTVRAKLSNGENDANEELMMMMRPLHYASQHGHTAVVKELIARGAQVGAKDNYIGYTPLHWAAEGGHVGAIEVLIDNGGADTEVLTGTNYTLSNTYTGSTPLHLACCNGRTG